MFCLPLTLLIQCICNMATGPSIYVMQAPSAHVVTNIYHFGHSNKNFLNLKTTAYKANNKHPLWSRSVSQMVVIDILTARVQITSAFYPARDQSTLWFHITSRCNYSMFALRVWPLFHPARDQSTLWFHITSRCNYSTFALRVWPLFLE